MCILSVFRQSCSGEHLIDHHLYVYEQQKVHLKIFKVNVKTYLQDVCPICLILMVFIITIPGNMIITRLIITSDQSEADVVVVVFVFDHHVVFVLF